MKTRIRILWNVLCCPRSTFSRQLVAAAERLDLRAPEADAAEAVETRVVESASLKLAEESVGRQLDELRVLFDLMPAMIWFKDTENRILRVNQRVADAAGIPRGEIEGKPSAEIYPKDAVRYHADDLEVIRSGVPKLTYVEMVRGPDGKEIWVHTDKLPVRDTDGKIVGIVVIAQDVTKWKLSEQALHDSEEKFRLLADNLTDAFWIRSADMGTLHYLSPGYEKIWGRPVVALQGNPHEWTDSIMPEDRERIRAVFATLTVDAPQVSAEYRIIRPGGEIRWVHARGFQVRDAAGDLLRLTGIVTDITERKEAEEVRREQAALLASAQRIGRMGSWRMHVPAGRLVWSDATCELFGIAPRGFTGTFEFFQSFIVEEDLPGYAAAHALVSPSNPVWEAEYRIHWRDGRLRWMYERGVAEFDSAGAGVTRTGMVMDVTERKLSEEKLRESLSLLRITGNIARVGGWALNVGDNDLCWSEEVWNILGFPRGKEPPLEKALNLCSPEYRDKLDTALTACRRDGTSIDLDLEFMDANGQKMWARVCGEAARDEDGKITRVHGAFSDITRGNQAAALLAANESLLREFIRHTPAAIAMLDTEMRYVQASERWIQDYKLADQDIIGRSHYEIFPDVPQTWKDIHARVLSGVVERCDEDAFPRADGSTAWLQWEARPWHGAGGEIRGVLFFTQVITERKLAEEELRWKTALLEAQVESYDLGILVVDVNGRQILQNSRMVELWQIPPGIAESDDDYAQVDFVADRTTRPKQFIDRVAYLYAHPNERSADEIEFIDGTVLDRYSAPVIGKDGRHYGRIWTFADITARKRAETERAALNQRLLDVSRQAGMAEVATNVLHNVGNVLNSVNISCSVIMEKVRKSHISGVAKTAVLLQRHQGDLAAFFTDDPAGMKLTEYIGKLAGRLSEEQAAISSELQSLRGNIDHIKEIVAMQQNLARVCGVTEIVAIKDLIEDGLRLSAGSLSRHNILIVREYAEISPVVIERHKVLQILVNLIGNAKSACNEAGRPDKQITLQLTADGETVRISVIDNGVGISAENFTRIFAHGFTTKSDGHGFGLHGSVLAAREMGGDLTVHSEGTGKGANFTLILPLSPS